MLPARGEAATIRDAQVTYFTNQAPRMAHDRYRAAGWDIGSGMVESACKHLIGARERPGHALERGRRADGGRRAGAPLQ
jgi:hypothetical protein